MRPRTGTEYSDDLRCELARNSSAEAQSFFSISVWFAGMSKTLYSTLTLCVLVDRGSIAEWEGVRKRSGRETT